jgi:hypothetical protein
MLRCFMVLVLCITTVQIWQERFMLHDVMVVFIHLSVWVVILWVPVFRIMRKCFKHDFAKGLVQFFNLFRWPVAIGYVNSKMFKYCLKDLKSNWYWLNKLQDAKMLRQWPLNSIVISYIKSNWYWLYKLLECLYVAFDDP